jgi:hypothetical protein
MFFTTRTDLSSTFSDMKRTVVAYLNFLCCEILYHSCLFLSLDVVEMSFNFPTKLFVLQSALKCLLRNLAHKNKCNHRNVNNITNILEVNTFGPSALLAPSRHPASYRPSSIWPPTKSGLLRQRSSRIGAWRSCISESDGIWSCASILSACVPLRERCAKLRFLIDVMGHV